MLTPDLGDLCLNNWVHLCVCPGHKLVGQLETKTLPPSPAIVILHDLITLTLKRQVQSDKVIYNNYKGPLTLQGQRQRSWVITESSAPDQVTMWPQDNRKLTFIDL